MPDNYALASYPGINQIEAFSGSMGLGITPGQFSLTIAPQPLVNVIPLVGDLTLTYNSVTIVFKDCRADVASFNVSTSGQVMGLVLKDWRWYWSYVNISGAYNTRKKDGSINTLIDPATGSPYPIDPNNVITNPRKTVRELCDILLTALKVDYDLGDLPDTLTPAVDWQHVNAAQALVGLLDPIGWTVAPSPDRRVRLVRLGVGAQLPQGAWETYGETFDPPEVPKKITVVCGPSRFEVDTRLEYVGLDVDGSVKPIKKLSYALDPNDEDGGFLEYLDREGDDFFEDEEDSPEKKAKLEAARRSLFKWFVPKTSAYQSGNFQLDGVPLKHIEQLYPFENNLVGTRKFIGEEIELPAFLYGVFVQDDETGENNTTKALADIDPLVDKETVWAGGVSVDGEHGIFKASAMVLKYDEEYIFVAADVRARFTASIRKLETGEYHHYRRSRDVDPTSPVDELTIYRPEIRYSEQYDGTNNKVKVDEECDHYIDELVLQYQSTQPSYIAGYVEWFRVELDGLNQSMTYELSASGPTLTVQHGSDSFNVKIPPYKERRYYERISEAVKNATNLQRNLRYIRRRESVEEVE